VVSGIGSSIGSVSGSGAAYGVSFLARLGVSSLPRDPLSFRPGDGANARAAASLAILWIKELKERDCLGYPIHFFFVFSPLIRKCFLIYASYRSVETDGDHRKNSPTF